MAACMNEGRIRKEKDGVRLLCSGKKRGKHLTAEKKGVDKLRKCGEKTVNYRLAG